MVGAYGFPEQPARQIVREDKQVTLLNARATEGSEPFVDESRTNALASD